jgi:2-oxoglutarate dehydrogenase E2 component (dihydrolipoamide succinyltransferase)
VQRIAATHGLDLSQISGSGRNGRIRKQDVLSYLEREQGTEPALPLHTESPYRPEHTAPETPIASARAGRLYEPPRSEPLSGIRRLIAEHMKRSLNTAATCTTWIEVDFTKLERTRQRLGVTALPIVARCTIETLGEFPNLNAWLEEDQYTQHADVNLGIAVSLGDEA